MPLPTGLYKLAIETPAGTDYGVAYLSADAKLRGGDSGMAYVGTYRQVGDLFTAELCVTQHRHVPGVTSALGYNDLVVQLEGVAGDYAAEVRGSSREVPSVRFSARLSHIAD
ncbi:hypothetical protein [Sphingomonas profundi]|uniref:hypothetical protein n=1 Tax=Alterirhizorhabdus profundi TaxID=2681549 RepID=UPI0012E82C6A|nr:hypothetical protein [Sphingomonas profundi]